jgi:hypothetical protein
MEKDKANEVAAMGRNCRYEIRAGHSFPFTFFFFPLRF